MTLLVDDERRSGERPARGGPELGVIEEARARQRRRRSRAAALVTIGALGAATVLLVRGGAHRPPAPRSSAHQPQQIAAVAPSVLLAEEPYMGVSCRIPNSIACDRVGLAVRLRRPAISVSATIAGSALSLNDPAWSGPSRNARRSDFSGFLQPAGMLNGPLKLRPDRGRYYWIGSHPRSARVQIVVNFGSRRMVQTTATVELHAGWG
jgi:hypothetical protein